MFEASGSFNQMTSTLTQKESNIEEVKTFVSATRADMLPYWGSNPSRMITMFIARMPKTYDENPKKYHRERKTETQRASERERENTAVYTAISVACGWAGAVISLC